MITDPIALAESQAAWEEVRTYRNIIVGNLNMAMFGGIVNQTPLRHVAFSLLLAHAFSVLERVLLEFRSQKVFGGRRNLESLMLASKTVVPWVDYAKVNTARLMRNDAIHKRIVPPHSDSRDAIAAIEIELHAWGVVQNTTPKLWHW